MAKDVYLFTGCSHVVETGMAGGGWTAACDGVIAYGNVALEGMARVADAEAAAGLAGVRGVLDAFPDAERILISTDGNELQFVPCGAVAEGIDPGEDVTGILAECRARGVELAIRWWPGHNPGPLAADIMLVAARVLAVHARRGNLRAETLPATQGWRSRLALSIGRSPFNNGIKEAGLTWRQAATLTGVADDRLPEYVARGHLKVAMPGSVSLSSALELRDDLEAAGDVTWPPEDFGGAYLAGWTGEPAARLFVAYHAHGKAHGVAVARRVEGRADVWSIRVRSSATANAHKAAVATAVQSLTQRLRHFTGGGWVEVVTTDPWLAMLLDSRRIRDAALTSALDALTERVRGLGLSIRPRLIREEVVRRNGATEAMAYMQVALGAARIASASEAFVRQAPDVLQGPDALLPTVLAESDALGAKLSQDAQARVTSELFGLVPSETVLRSRFEALAHVTDAAGAACAFVRRPILPGAHRGGLVRAGDGVHPPTPVEMPGSLREEWKAFWRDYGLVRSRDPALALRESILLLDAEPDLARWPKARHLAVAAWIAGGDVPCPFALPERLREPARVEMAPLLEACGRWPFTWVRVPDVQAA